MMRLNEIQEVVVLKFLSLNIICHRSRLTLSPFSVATCNDVGQNDVGPNDVSTSGVLPQDNVRHVIKLNVKQRFTIKFARAKFQYKNASTKLAIRCATFAIPLWYLDQ